MTPTRIALPLDGAAYPVVHLAALVARPGEGTELFIADAELADLDRLNLVIERDDARSGYRLTLDDFPAGEPLPHSHELGR